MRINFILEYKFNNRNLNFTLNLTEICQNYIHHLFIFFYSFIYIYLIQGYLSIKDNYFA